MHRLSRISALGVVVVVLTAASLVRAQAVDTVRPFTQDTGSFKMTKSPTMAVVLSALVPGAGQVYLGQTWKVPIIWGLAGSFLYGALVQNGRYHEWADSTRAAEARGDAYYAVIYGNRREFYRDDRDKWWIYLGLTYVANILDAYIAAHLYDFDVSDPGTSPSKMLTPTYDFESGAVGLGVSWRF
jgi:hypothetical protein